MATENLFHWADYIIFVLTIIGTLAIGLFSALKGRKKADLKEYLLGSRNLHLVPVTMSLVASYVSAITVLGNPAEIFYHGPGIFIYPLAAFWYCPLLAFLWVPLFYPLLLTSMYEYLELRFKSRTVRIIGTVANVVAEIAYTGIAVFAPSVAIAGIVGVPIWVSMVILVVLCTIYTTMGGIKAVVWTDSFQSCIMVGSIVTVLIVGTVRVGGVGEVVRYLNEGGRLTTDFKPDPSSRFNFWAAFLGMGFHFCCMTSGQPAVQRFSSLPSIFQAKTMYLAAMFGFPFMFFLSAGAGAVAFAFYTSKGCDPLAGGIITDSNQILPYFVADLLRIPGIIGLFMACIFCAVLSTISSTQNSLAANIWEDFLKPRWGDIPDEKQTFIVKIVVVIIGGCTLAFGFLASVMGGTVMEITALIMGATLGPRFAMIILGGAFSFVGAPAVTASCLIGFGVSILTIGLNMFIPFKYHQLPTTTTNCSSFQPLYNFTGDSTTPEYTTVQPSLSTAMFPGNSTIPEALPYFFNISPYYYSLLGFIVTFSFGLLFSIIPQCRANYKVKSKYRFMCCRNVDSDDEEEDDEFRFEPNYAVKVSKDSPISALKHRNRGEDYIRAQEGANDSLLDQGIKKPIA